jgi:putative membrane protein
LTLSISGQPTGLTLLDWSLEPTVLGGLALLGGAYVALAAGAPTAPRGQATPVWYGLGLATLFVALQSPIDVGGDRYLFSLHMLQHVLLAMVAPPLLLLGLAGLHLRRVAPAGWGILVHPWLAAILFNTVLLVWHVPPLYDATLRNEPLHVLEHLTFFVTGLLFWWPLIPAVRAAGATAMSPLAKIAYLVFTGIPPTILGLLFAVAPRAYYPFYLTAPRLWGLTPVEDQQIAGLVMFGLGGMIYVAAIAVLFVQFAKEAETENEVFASAE